MTFEEQMTKLDYEGMDIPSVSHVTLKRLGNTISGILDGEYVPDREKIKNKTRNLTKKLLEESNGFDKMRGIYENMKPLRIAKRADKSEIDPDILSCISIAFQIGNRDSSPLLALHTIFDKLRKAHKRGHLLTQSLERLEEFARGAITEVKKENRRKRKKK